MCDVIINVIVAAIEWLRTKYVCGQSEMERPVGALQSASDVTWCWVLLSTLNFFLRLVIFPHI